MQQEDKKKTVETDPLNELPEDLQAEIEALKKRVDNLEDRVTIDLKLKQRY